MGRRATSHVVAIFAAASIATCVVACDDAAESAQPDGSQSGTAAPDSSGAPEVPERPEPTAAPTCRGTEECLYEGRCEGAPGSCVADGAADCQASTGCKDWGTCHAEDGRCVASSDDDCQSSWICKNKGRCTHKRGACVVGRDADCKRSNLCKYERKCQANEGRCRK